MIHPQKILDQLGTRAKKNLSQNFLTSPQWGDKLSCALDVDEQSFTEVWEVGPGLGAVTEHVLKKSTVPVKLFELDVHLISYLEKTFSGIEIVSGDILSHDWGALTQDKKIHLISNLPYAISSPLLFRVIEFLPSFDSMVVTFQKEFAQRLIAEVGTKSYGALSVLIQTHFEIQKMGDLLPNCFFPKPQVASTALWFKRSERTALTSSQAMFIKMCFSQRRKQLGRLFKQSPHRDQVISALSEWGMNEKVRAEELSPERLIRLSEICEN